MALDFLNNMLSDRNAVDKDARSPEAKAASAILLRAAEMEPTISEQQFREIMDSAKRQAQGKMASQIS